MERLRWKLQIAFEGTERPVKDLIERIKIISEGKLKLRYYGVNTLVPGSELHSAVSEGQVDAGFTTPGYLARKIPAVIFFRRSSFRSEVFGAKFLDETWRRTKIKGPNL